jgi:hypothetical protein
MPVLRPALVALLALPAGSGCLKFPPGGGDGGSCGSGYEWVGPDIIVGSSGVGTLTFTFPDGAVTAGLVASYAAASYQCSVEPYRTYTASAQGDTSNLPLDLQLECWPRNLHFGLQLQIPDLRTFDVGTVAEPSLGLGWGAAYVSTEGNSSFCTGPSAIPDCPAFPSTADAALTIDTATGQSLAATPYVSDDFERVGQLHLGVVIAPGTPSGSPAQLPSFDLLLDLHQDVESYQGVGSYMVGGCE